MTLALSQSFTAIGPGITSSFLASGGTPAYVYSVRPNGAGGTINSSTGIYTAPVVPAAVNSEPYDPNLLYDTVQVEDSLGAITTAQIFIGNPLELFCDVLQNQLGLDNDHIYLWDQKIFEPTDSSLYIAVSVLTCRPFGNTNTFNSAGQSVQSVNMYANLEINAISRGPAARDRKEEIILALNSNYAQSQQYANSFYIGKLPAGSQFRNLSNIDGAAIPYRFNIDVAIQYFVSKITDVPYFDSFNEATITVEP